MKNELFCGLDDIINNVIYIFVFMFSIKVFCRLFFIVRKFLKKSFIGDRENRND